MNAAARHLHGFEDPGPRCEAQRDTVLTVHALLPPILDASERAHPGLVAAFGLLTLVTLSRSFAHLLLPDGGAQSIATIPLEAFGPAAADAVVFVFALWGLAQALMGAFYVVALVRYQALIPFCLLLMVLEYGARVAIGQARPIETASTAPGAIGNYVMIPLTLGLLVWSLTRRTAQTDRM